MFQDVSNSTVVDHIARNCLVPAFDMKADFFDALSSGDIERAASTFSADGELLFPGLRPVRGHSLLKRMLGIIRRRYDDIVWTSLRAPIQSADWMVVSWEVVGTFRDSAMPYENEGVSIIRLDAHGKIAMLSDYFKDTLAFQPRVPLAASITSHTSQLSAA